MTLWGNLLPDPEVKYYTDENGEKDGVLIHFQKRKGKRVIQPNPTLPVYLSVDEHGLPVCLKILGSVSCYLVINIIHDLVLNRDGTPAGVNQRAECDVVEFMDVVCRKVVEASDALAPAGA